MLNLAYIQQLRQHLDSHPCLNFDVRTKILYPLLDEIYCEGDRLNISLENGLNFDFLYRSNLAKEILLRDVENPGHVWEPMTTRSVQFAIRHKPGSVVVGGAYFGDHALIAAHEILETKNPGLVICVEPNHQQRAMLEANAALNNLSDIVRSLDYVLWSNSGLKFNLAPSDSHASVVADANATYISKTIDEILADHDISEVSLVLIDIEGSEEMALRGANSILSARPECAPVVIAEIHKNYVDWSCGLAKTSIVRYLEDHGYSVFALRDCQSNWCLGLDAPEIIPLESVFLEGPPHGFNLIAVKDTSFFQDNGFHVVHDVSPKYLRHRDPALHLPLHLCSK